MEGSVVMVGDDMDGKEGRKGDGAQMGFDFVKFRNDLISDIPESLSRRKKFRIQEILK